MQPISLLGELAKGNLDDLRDSPYYQKLLAHLPEGAGDWDILFHPPWCSVRPGQMDLPAQGWKIHLSAVNSNAGEVLREVFDLAVARRCAFKFAATPGNLRLLNSFRFPRESAGKFVTMYPRDETEFRLLLDTLTNRCRGFPGPEILSDRAAEPGSIVHYRYGAFRLETMLSQEGDYRSVIRAPDGSRTEDQRRPWFHVPSWVEHGRSPHGGTAGEPVPQQDIKVVLHDRYEAYRAIRHANKGGVFWGRDLTTGRQVVIKQARRHVGSGFESWDVQQGLRQEARLLRALGPVGVTPQLIDLFDQQGDLFLVEQRLDGLDLREWLTTHIDPARAGLPWQALRTMLLKIISTVEKIHQDGTVLRDLAPGNLIVAENDRLYVIDLELSGQAGRTGVAGGTPGYAAPEQLAGLPSDFPADAFSVGGLCFLMATGCEPQIPADAPAARSLSERLGRYLELAGQENPSAAAAAPLVTGLSENDPAKRWTLQRAREYLRSTQAEQHPAALNQRHGSQPAGRPGEPAPMASADRLIDDCIQVLLQSMTVTGGNTLWPVSCRGAQMHPCSVYHGAGGVLSALLCAYEHGRIPPDGTGLVAEAAHWIARRAGTDDELIPGLYFGHSGIAWVLYDAGRILGQETLRRKAVQLALRIPVYERPDVTHGLAGAGLAAAHLWAGTHEPQLLERIRLLAQRVADTADTHGRQVSWAISAETGDDHAPLRHYGFAHGIAGIGYFLHVASMITGSQAAGSCAAAAAGALMAVARTRDDYALWPIGPDNDIDADHWCSGSSGIGSFLCRLEAGTQSPKYRQITGWAANAAWQRRWMSSLCDCHGAAGTGQFLLDLAGTGNQDSFGRALQMAQEIHTRSSLRDGLLLPIDYAIGEDVSMGYSLGISGVLAFLLRLRHGGPRPFMPDELHAL